MRDLLRHAGQHQHRPAVDRPTVDRLAFWVPLVGSLMTSTGVALWLFS